MDVRIVNRNGDMFAVGERTIKVYGNTLILFDQKTNTVEYVENYHDTGMAESIKKLIVGTINELQTNFNRMVLYLDEIEKYTKESD